SGIANVVDPLGGSYFVERLTADLAESAVALLTEVEACGGMTRAVAAGWPKQRILAAATRRQARIERGLDIIVGVNRFVAEPGLEPAVELRSIDNRAVRAEQIARLERVRAARNASEVERCLNSLAAAANDPRANVLEAALPAVRARATLGEISLALERVWGRYAENVSNLTGTYGGYYADAPAWQALSARTRAFETRTGRRPRLLVAKLGQDGHDRGARLIATAFADAGFDVDLGPLFQTPEEVARQAVDHDVHAVGISTQAGAHLTLVPELIEQLRALGAVDIVTVCGGVIPEADHTALRAAGVADIFGPGTPIVLAIERLLDRIDARTSAEPPNQARA
ncbi:MAG TPA: methylmalonyl-CoA mutase family protein, partial [Polyangiaceae bacterium]|nr:methylmalonyl-CoA mutase family protein [Polyangiaceae bacterium]